MSQSPCLPRPKASLVRPQPFLSLLLLIYAALPAIAGAQQLFPLRDIRPGLHGVGRTVFSGNQVEEFQVQILGVLENLTPKQSIILAKLSGGPLAETGVMQGMSGSPVFIDGKLVGAIALGFPFSKEPIAGIQPIEQMLGPTTAVTGQNSVAFAAPAQPSLISANPPSARIPFSLPSTSSIGGMKEIFTPLSLSGFTAQTLQTFKNDFQKLGFDPQQGVSSASPQSQGFTGTVVPGSMISVQLLSGDLSISADGTVTYVKDKQVWAFGHRFLDSGTTDLPFARADVVALLPTLNSSFKLSAAREWVGTITSDTSTAIAGLIGAPAHTIPMLISVQSPATPAHPYQLQVVNDRLLTPFLIQTALFSTLDATERTTGPASIQIQGQIDFDGGLPSLSIQDVAAGDAAAVQQAATDAVVPLGFVLGAGFRDLSVRHISYTLEAVETKRQLHIAQAWTSRGEVRPGETIELNLLLEGENGFETTRSASYHVPIGAPLGALFITASDALTLNGPDFAGLSQSALHSSAQLIDVINHYRGSNAAYVRFWRQQPAFTINGPAPAGDLTDPPPSVALVLADGSSSPATNAASTVLRGSQLAEVKIPFDRYVVTGAKTVQVEVVD